MRLLALLAVHLALGGCERSDVAPSTSAPEEAAAEADPDAYAMLMRRGGPASPVKGAIIGGEWIFDTPTGAGWLAAPLPPPEIRGRKRHFRLKHVELAIEPGACADPLLRTTLPDAVSVTGTDRPFAGCGGPRPPLREMQGSHWQVLRLGNMAAPGEGAPTIVVFAEDGQVGGSLACNDVGIGTRWTDGRFIQPEGEQGIAGTAVGCEGPDVEFGDLFWSAMYRATSWQRRGDRLRILLSDGSEAELRLIL